MFGYFYSMIADEYNLRHFMGCSHDTHVATTRGTGKMLLGYREEIMFAIVAGRTATQRYLYVKYTVIKS